MLTHSAESNGFRLVWYEHSVSDSSQRNASRYLAKAERSQNTLMALRNEHQVARDTPNAWLEAVERRLIRNHTSSLFSIDVFECKSSMIFISLVHQR